MLKADETIAHLYSLLCFNMIRRRGEMQPTAWKSPEGCSVQDDPSRSFRYDNGPVCCDEKALYWPTLNSWMLRYFSLTVRNISSQ